ncbi:hypothetical protein GCK72_021276 [Caenorhabditis remanei]|uniref:F-box domain-containing protein n=1 Tax=Caenorhabditis remanei TaxID=31234 RepID=A0A6A5GJN4_CAERE|nr:hypothetical protein GCK72_021276 [Caenorhabditis remanei]KAF1754712.1 hypothetical protein GCK72_021276 [Caenorhabditis remanei]
MPSATYQYLLDSTETPSSNTSLHCLPEDVCLPKGHSSRVAVVSCGLPSTPPDIDSSSHLYSLSAAKMTTPFPLLRLPRLALIPVFQQMELIEVIAFSLISQKSYNLSKYLRKKTSFRYIGLEIENNCVRMRIALTDGSSLTLYFYTDVLTTVEVFCPYKKIQWKNIGLSAEQWIQRVFNITKCSFLSKLWLNGTPDNNVLSFFNVVSKVSDLQISLDCTNAFATQALQILLPVTSSITLFKVPFSTREEFQRFWLRDVKCLTIYNKNLSRFQFNLNYLLVSNAVKLDLREISLRLSDLNRFFSRWLNKKSNHRLEHLSVKSVGHFDEDVLLKGLNATRFTENRTREFSFFEFKEVAGGFDVRRIDGKLAAITFGSCYKGAFINFDACL